MLTVLREGQRRDTRERNHPWFAEVKLDLGNISDSRDFHEQTVFPQDLHPHVRALEVGKA